MDIAQILRQKLDKGDDSDLFMAGACFHLAWEIHHEFGLPFRATSTHGELAHVWCLLPDNQNGVDAEGVRLEREIVKVGWDPSVEITSSAVRQKIEARDIAHLEDEIASRARDFIAIHLHHSISKMLLNGTSTREFNLLQGFHSATPPPFSAPFDSFLAVPNAPFAAVSITAPGESIGSR